MRLSLTFVICLAAYPYFANSSDITRGQPLNFHDSNDLKFIQRHVLIASANHKVEESNFEELSKVYAKSVKVEIVDGPVKKNDLTVPVSNCLFNSKGSGGSIGYTGSFSISNSASISPSLVEPILGAITLGGGLSVGKSIGPSISYSCTVSEGGVAQLQATPIYVSFQYRTKESYFNALTNEMVEEAASWSEVKAGSLPIIQTPVFRCVNGSAAICSIPPTNLTLPSAF